MRWEIVEDREALSSRAARVLLEELDGEPSIVLGLPTGATPTGMYDRVVSVCAAEAHCFEEARAFALDEYVGLAPDDPRSFRSYLRRHLVDAVDLDPSRFAAPDGSAASLDEACERYEEAISAAGGLDLTFLGLGVNGHLAFNEPGSPFDSRTRVVDLAPATRWANAEAFGGPAQVPQRAITMGIGTILESRRIVLLVSGKRKLRGLARLREAVVDVALPASALHLHDEVLVITDRAAAGG